MKTCILSISLLLAATSAFPQLNRPLDEGKRMQRNETLSAADARVSPRFLLAGSESLSAGITCLNGGESVVIWNEDFNDGTDGWTLENAEAFSWELKQMTGDKAFAAIDPADTQSLFISGPYRYADRGTATAVSPEIDIARNMTFSGYAGYSYNLSEDYCSLTVYVSEDGTEWTRMWSCLDNSEVKTWQWHRFEIDMTAFAGKKVRFKFEYGNTESYDNAGYMGDFAIDGLQLSGTAEATSIDVMTGEIVKFADASTGNPTSWQWSFPGGTPASSTEQFPQVYYTRDGAYDVSLTVGDGTATSSKTLTAFVNVTGTKPTAKIGLPATFRFSETRLPMIAPLVPVRFSDLSEGFPTEREWTFTGADEDPSTTVSSTEENPEMSFMFRHKQGVFLTAANLHGESAAMEEVSVEYEGLVNNLRPEDNLFTFDLDGYGEFPGTNKLEITEYAEKFSKPSQPMLVYGAAVYFTKAETVELIDQIADVKVALCRSENGLPGEQLEFVSWRVFELDMPSGSQLVGTAFEFSKPVIVDDEFFIVVSGIPEKNETCTVSFATARFRDKGNTAYFKQRGEWKAASDYFPAGANHTSYAISVSMRHSVMSALSEVPITVGADAGETKFSLFSLMGYQTPVASDSEWCRVTGKPNGMTVDEITIAYDALPQGSASRTATLTFTDGVTAVDVEVIQEPGDGIAAVGTPRLTVSPSLASTSLSAGLPEGCTAVEIFSASGNSVYRTETEANSLSVDVSGFMPGVYIVKAIAPDGISTAKFIKR